MKKLFSVIAVYVYLFYPAFAANVNIDALPAASSVTGTDLLECEQGGINRKCTAAQTAAYIYSLFSGDITVNSSGVATLKNTGPGATGPLGSATVAPIVTIDAQGRITALSSATVTPAIGNITGLGTGVAGAAAATLNSGTGLIGSLTPTNSNCVVGNGSAWTSTTCPGGGGGTPGGSTTQVQYNNAGAFGGITGATTNGTALTLVAPVLGTPASGTLTNTTGFPVANLAGAGTGILASLAANVGSAGAPVLFNGAGGTPSAITLTNGTGLPIAGLSGLGTGVATMLGTAVSVAGGSTITVATGSLALATGAITSGACTSAQTATATNAASTDTISFTPNADITAVTGYAPVTTGGLAIYPWITANTANFKICNPTSSSITPGAVTLNWRITR